MSHDPEKGGVPAWEFGIRQYEAIAESRLLSPESTLNIGIQLLGTLLRSKLLPNIGELQEYFHEKDSNVQLAAWEFKPLQYPGCVCIDPLTEEPRTHHPVITIGNDTSEFGRELAVLRADHARNVFLLREVTGLVVLRHGGVG